MDVREQRVQFVMAAVGKEKPFRTLCKEFGVSGPTGRLWMKRYLEQGVEGIAERSRRPHHSPRKTSANIEQQVVEIRERFPDWGARKLQQQLRQGGVQVTVSTVHRILLRHGMVAEDDRHRPAPQRFERAAPNELWQMDFKSPIRWATPVGPLSVLDDHSRYVVVLHAIAHAGGDLEARNWSMPSNNAVYPRACSWIMVRPGGAPLLLWERRICRCGGCAKALACTGAAFAIHKLRAK